jgi:hypothetical protein
MTLRPLTFLIAAAALGAAATHAVRAQPGAMDGPVQPFAVQVVVHDADPMTAVRFESDPDVPGRKDRKVFVSRTMHSTSGEPTVIPGECMHAPKTRARHQEPLAPLRS